MKIVLISVLCCLLPLSLIAEPISLDQALSEISEAIRTQIEEGDDTKVQTLAVYQFSSENGAIELADFFTRELTTYLAFSGGELIKVLSRDKVDDLLTEHKFQLSGLADEEQIAEVGKKLSAQYLGTGYLTIANDLALLNFQLIHVESGEIVTGESVSIALTNEFLGMIDTSLTSTVVDPTGEYVFFDDFKIIDDKIWPRIRKDKDVLVVAEEDILHITVQDRQGVNATSLISENFRVSSFIMEVSFRDPLYTSNWISITVVNSQAERGAAFQIVANIYDGYYVCRWREKGKMAWIEDDDGVLDTVGDEDSVFHTLALAYDLPSKAAFAYVDGKRITLIEEFVFNRRDRLQVRLAANCVGPDMHIQFDDFKSTVDDR